MYVEHVLKATAQGSATRERILDAAFETLRQEGFKRTTARAVARRGGFNQALIFYHFGTLTDLLLAALDRVGETRRQRYEEALGPLAPPLELAAKVRLLYAEDVDWGTRRSLPSCSPRAPAIPSCASRWSPACGPGWSSPNG